LKEGSTYSWSVAYTTSDTPEDHGGSGRVSFSVNLKKSGGAVQDSVILDVGMS